MKCGWEKKVTAVSRVWTSRDLRLVAWGEAVCGLVSAAIVFEFFSPGLALFDGETNSSGDKNPIEPKSGIAFELH